MPPTVLSRLASNDDEGNEEKFTVFLSRRGLLFSRKSKSSGDSDSEPVASSSSSSSKDILSSFKVTRAADPFQIPSGSASAYSSGGGSKFTLGSESSFPGRQAGGADRSEVFGTSRIGSGYIYSVNGTFIYGRGFPFVFVPIAFANDYYGSGEYENIYNRPGGDVITAVVQPANNTINPVTYHIVGDSSSVESVFTALVLNCSVANSSSIFTPYTPSLTADPQPEQIIQWYRASTFALSLDGYNNTAATYSNQPKSDSDNPLPLSDDTPLPSMLNYTFLECVNQTIGSSVPMFNPPVDASHLSIGQIIGIAVGVATGLSILSMLLKCCWGCCCRRSTYTWSHDDTNLARNARARAFTSDLPLGASSTSSRAETSANKERPSQLYRSSSSVSSTSTVTPSK